MWFINMKVWTSPRKRNGLDNLITCPYIVQSIASCPYIAGQCHLDSANLPAIPNSWYIYIYNIIYICIYIYNNILFQYTTSMLRGFSNKFIYIHVDNILTFCVYGGCPKIGYYQYGWFIMENFIMENPIEMDDLEWSILGNPHIDVSHNSIQPFGRYTFYSVHPWIIIKVVHHPL